MPRRGQPHRGSNARHGEVDLRLRIDVVPLADLDLVHAPHEEEHALLGDLHDGEIGAWDGAGEEAGVEGAGGGAGRDRLGGVGEEGLGSTPLPQPHPPNRPLPLPQHMVHSAEVPAGQIPSNLQGLLRGGGVQVRGVGLVVFVCAVRGPQVKKSPVQPILGVGGGAGNPWWRLVACPPSAAEWCPSAPPPPPPGPSPLAPPPGSPVTSRGSYSGGTPTCPCCWGGAPRGGWRHRCGGAGPHSPHSPQ